MFDRRPVVRAWPESRAEALTKIRFSVKIYCPKDCTLLLPEGPGYSGWVGGWVGRPGSARPLKRLAPSPTSD